MKTRLIASGVAAGAFVASLFYLLATSIPATVERSLTDDALTATSSAVELPELRYQRVYDTQAIYRVRLLTNDLADLVSHSEIRLLVANFGTSPHLEVGEISVPSWNCTFRTVVREEIGRAHV